MSGEYYYERNEGSRSHAQLTSHVITILGFAALVKQAIFLRESGANWLGNFHEDQPIIYR